MSQKATNSSISVPSQIFLGCLLGLGVILALEARSSFELGSSGTRVSVHGDRTTIHAKRGDSRLEAEFEGRVELAADGTGFAKLGKGASVKIRTHRQGDRHRMIVTPAADGGVSYRWRVNGKSSKVDDSALEWLRQVSTQILRVTGLQARERVDYLLNTGQVAAVLREINEIRSDPVRATYFEHLAEKTELTPFELSSALDIVAKSFSSDHHSSRVLQLLVSPTDLESPRVSESYLLVTSTIDSDHELSKALRNLLDQPETTATTRQLVVRCVGTISSDFELATVLLALVTTTPASEDLPSGYDQALETINSDFEQRRAMDAAIQHPGLSPEQLARILSTASSIGSDVELAELLSQVAHSRPPGEALPSELFDVAGSIDSDRELRRVLTAVIDRGQLDGRVLTAVLETASSIGSSFEAAELLVHLVRESPVDISRESAFEALLANIDSRFENERVQKALAGVPSKPLQDPLELPVDAFETETHTEPAALEAPATDPHTS